MAIFQAYNGKDLHLLETEDLDAFLTKIFHTSIIYRTHFTISTELEEC